MFPQSQFVSSRRRHGKPEHQRNIPSAFFGLVVTGLFAITMAEPSWFHLNGGVCSGKHVGLYTIFGDDKSLIKSLCINSKIITKQLVCTSLCLLGILTSMLQFSLDVCGANRRGLVWLRHNSIGNIFSVLITIALILICYWITVDISKIELQGGIKLSGQLDIAFYLIIGAGVAATVAVTLSLLQITCEKRERHRHYESDMQLQLIANEMQDELPPLVSPPPPYLS